MKKIYIKPIVEFEEVEELMDGMLHPSRIKNEGTDPDNPVDPIEIDDPTDDPGEL